MGGYANSSTTEPEKSLEILTEHGSCGSDFIMMSGGGGFHSTAAAMVYSDPYIIFNGGIRSDLLVYKVSKLQL